MTQLPEILKSYQTSAEEYLAKGLVRDIEFSDRTYQVQVFDAETEDVVWAFLQLDSTGGLKDAFCSCEEGEHVSSCVHLAAAFLRIYNDQPLPLHQRFQQSLWNQLCRIYADRLGDDPDILVKMAQGYYMHTSAGGRAVFYIKGKTPEAIEQLQEILENRQKETEETSLKFSNLAHEELVLWREGRPSAQLSYELSFWNDFAHWLMRLQDEKEPYKISFSYSSRKIPNQIQLDFAELEMSFYLSEANLPLIVESLATVKSPLSVHHVSQDTIKRITYDEVSSSLIIEPQDLKEGKGKKKIEAETRVGYTIDGWLYIPGDGFYAQERHQLLATPRIPAEQISEALNEHLAIIESRLEGVSLYRDPLQLSYALNFDPEWNLHINAYAFTPGDLSHPRSRYFGEWIYLQGDGFYRIEKDRFGKVETIISSHDMEDFIRHERAWLNAQEGFHVYLTNIEAELTYQLSPESRLTFSKLVSIDEANLENKDFGSWMYVSGKGFYSKVGGYTGLQLRAGITINADQIPLFIRMNREELQLIPGFFSEKNPLARMGLNISLLDSTVSVAPEYEILPEHAKKDVRFFDDVVYIEGEGFYELPFDHRLPEQFQHAMVLAPEMLPLFFTHELDALKPYIINIDPRLVKPAEIHLYAKSISKAETEGWYALKLGFKTSRGFIPLNVLLPAISKKKRFLFTDAGLLDLEDEEFKWMRLLPKSRLNKRQNILLLSTLELIRLHALEEIETSDEASSNSQALLHELTEFRIPNEPNLTGLTSELRPYQKLGVHWLWFLYQHNLSGLLCDDMGLGKTHQAMALLAAIINEKKDKGGEPRHFLIVCPTSVIFHWQEKLESFLSGIRVCTFYGANRSLQEFHQHYDVLLTSYGIWRIENELLSTVSFDVAIFDEIQIAKNHRSRVHRFLLTAHAKMRLGLTGTPIENHLRELKALFDLVLPAYMPGDQDYREMFVKPIEKEGRQERRDLLKRFIKPFVLRRKKEDVLLDLPEKTEEIAHCVLLPDQQLLYTEVLDRSRSYLLQRLQDSESSIPYVHVFALLSALKQICNHPAAFLKIPEEYKNYSSGKWELFVELLDEARESQQKVVIFSQYLAMLDIFEEYLNELGMGFATIRGATVNRGEQVHRFNNDPQCEVFLGSLQAAGLGVDLTAGSVVIHYDRWWNAARENQATDRVHRIGQVRGVQVFKLVTKGTFEERIDQLITKKARLMEDVVGVDDHRFIKQFTREELIQLLTLEPM